MSYDKWINGLKEEKKYWTSVSALKAPFNLWAKKIFPYPEDHCKVLFAGAGSRTCLREEHYDDIGIDPLARFHKEKVKRLSYIF